MSEPAAFTSARAVADAVLYEGYLLYPYRRSSGKNRVRWQFGVLGPRGWIEARGGGAESVAGSADAWRQRTECLLEARDTAAVHLRLRFLQLQHRSVQQRGADGEFGEVDTLDVAGERHLSFEEAVPREFDVHATVAELAERGHTVELTVPGGEDVEALGDGAARVVRTRWPLALTVRLSVSVAAAPFPLSVLRVDTENAVADLDSDTPRSRVLRHCLVAAHSLLAVRGGAFLSLLDPPAWAAHAAKQCVNLHTFPVLAGEGGGRDALLSSPIIMYDHPQVAPESPGDLFDACEIDEILSLRTLTLTDEEKREARATDPRAAAIIDRVDVIPKELYARLHGAVRSLRPVAEAPGEMHSELDGTAEPTGVSAVMEPPPLPMPQAPWWDPGADASVSPGTDAVLVAGVRVARGSRVRLHPRARGTDVHDMFLKGRTALVEAILLDVDDSRHVAVVLEDDPGADLHQWYGRHYHFAPEELQPLDEASPPTGQPASAP